MIGRADIEGSKSDVAMNAWPPQASYPCGNFSDTSCIKLVKSKGSIGPAFAVRIRTENQDQASFCPFTLREVSVLAELALGHLRYLLTDVPPQSNFQPDAVFGADRARRLRPGAALIHKRGLSRAQSRCSAPPASDPSRRAIPQANPCPEVHGYRTCRLPLPYIVLSTKAVHLGDLLLMGYGPARNSTSLSDLQGPRQRPPGQPQSLGGFYGNSGPLSPDEPFRDTEPFTKKRQNSSPGPSVDVSRVRLR
ncbi:putative uncharacterized protein ART2 like protein [Argiope bruennichi]|uniref:Senescence-associated protein n=1 Tax=Argiope bruennichi TaxID=94029 RepID=A0A8T0F183_ARGBR|nr:putative uncharacterized protein ART2 like protein [Argiope bruennichi]